VTLVNVHHSGLPVDFDIAYATDQNFTGQPIYDVGICYLHGDALEHLSRAVTLAQALRLRFVVFDAFRPSEAQWRMWDHTPDPEFLADPRTGSPHSRGVAVDLTLAGEDGERLDMGTDFDAFTPLSHHGCTDVSAEALANRSLLLGLMTAAGWDFYKNEWWHYQLPRARDYALLSDRDLSAPMMSSNAVV